MEVDKHLKLATICGIQCNKDGMFFTITLIDETSKLSAVYLLKEDKLIFRDDYYIIYNLVEDSLPESKKDFKLYTSFKYSDLYISNTILDNTYENLVNSYDKIFNAELFSLIKKYEKEIKLKCRNYIIEKCILD